MEQHKSFEEIVTGMKSNLESEIKQLNSLIQEYGSFMVIANSFARNQIAMNGDEQSLHQPALPEYIAVLCLKRPYSIGRREFENPQTVAADLDAINQLAATIYSKYTFIHHSKYRNYKSDGALNTAEHIAQLMSSYELNVRNPTFESFHFDLLEELYGKYGEYFRPLLGVSVSEAIDIVLTIGDHIASRFKEGMTRYQANIREHYDEVMAFKLRGKKPKNYYPEELLVRYKAMQDHHIRIEFEQSMMTYEMVMMGEMLNFTAAEIAEIEGLPVEGVTRFLNILSIGFGELPGDVTEPEIMSPLKDRPLVIHEGRYIVCSISLLDYSLDRLFQKYLLKDPATREKYKLHRHEYLLNTGMKLLSDALQAKNYYSNLRYEGGELDGLIMFENYLFLIEAKGHILTDRAKRGYIDRIENDIRNIINGSYSQAIRTLTYLSGKKEAIFRNTKGQKIVVDGRGFKNVFFISLVLDDFSTFSCNIKVNNSLGLFTKDTFPWIISLYDLRAVCEHMEGPAYLIHYLYRRKVFFNYEKFSVQDELDVLGYYLKRNLWFGDLIESKYDNVDFIHLNSVSEEFNKYYSYLEGRSRKFAAKMKHYSLQPTKNLVSALEQSRLPFSIDAAIQVLSFGTKTKKELTERISLLKRKYRRDKKNHDFRIGGTDYNGESWMFSYWMAPIEEGLIEFFDDFIAQKYKELPADRYVAILDCGENDYRFVKVVTQQREINYV